MDWNKLKFTKLETEIMRFLFRNPTTSFNGKELATSLKVSQTAIAKYSKRLAKLGLVSLEKKVLLSIKLNRENRGVFILKRVENIREMYATGLVNTLSETFPSATLVLFGSYSYGEDTEESDVDIAVIGYKEKSINLKTIEAKLQRKVQLQFFEETKEINKNLKENIFNGIILEGVMKL